MMMMPVAAAADDDDDEMRRDHSIDRVNCCVMGDNDCCTGVIGVLRLFFSSSSFVPSAMMERLLWLWLVLVVVVWLWLVLWLVVVWLVAVVLIFSAFVFSLFSSRPMHN